MPCLQHRNTDLRLTSCTRCQASSVVSSTEASSSGEMPALLNRTSMRPYCSATWAYICWTATSSVTSTASARSPGAPSSRSTPTTVAPSRWKTSTVAAPMPPGRARDDATLPSSRPGTQLPFGVVEDRLDLGVGVGRVRPELAAVAGLLEAAERRRHAHRAVGVDRQVAALQRPGDAQRLRAVARPDRAREPVDGVVGDADRLGLVVERDDHRDRPEDLVVDRAVVVAARATARSAGTRSRGRPGPSPRIATSRRRRRTTPRSRAAPRRSAAPCRSPRRAGRRRAIASTAPSKCDRKSSTALRSTRIRERAQQSWPALSNTAPGAASAAASTSASANTMLADLPPSSSVTRLIVAAAPAAIDAPDLGRARERDLRDVRMLDQPLPARRARARRRR